MKKKIISFIGLALFVGAIFYNFQTNTVDYQTNDLTLKNIEAIALTGIETDCTEGCTSNIEEMCTMCGDDGWCDYQAGWEDMAYTGRCNI